MNRYFPESKPKYVPHVKVTYEAMIQLKAGTKNRLIFIYIYDYNKSFYLGIKYLHVMIVKALLVRT